MESKELVKEVLAKQGITPYRLAKEMKVSNSAVYRWIHGEKAPNGQHTMELLRRAGRLAAAVFVGLFVGVLLQQNAIQGADLAALPLLGVTAETLCIMLNTLALVFFTMRAVFPNQNNNLLPSVSQ